MKIRPADSLEWYKDNGDNTLRVNYNLTPFSVVVDIGARHGHWADQIKLKYGTPVYCFEVVKEFCRQLKNKGYIVFQKAVYNQNGILNIGIEEDEGSIFHEKNTFEMQSIKASDIFVLINHNHIDLMKINVEGAEYAILNQLIDTGAISRIQNIQVQFHVLNNSEQDYKLIESKLKKTHKLTWRYPFVWENWERLICE